MNDTPGSSLRIAVVGGGISGLAAAFRAVELAPQTQLVLFERQRRLGGVLDTVEEEGFQIEQSADNFITTVPWGVDLCKRVGLADELIQTNPAHRHTFVVCRGRLRRLPDGFLMMAPTRLWPMAVTPILSPMGKIRAAVEYLLPPRKDPGDESMAAFVRRRLGREVFDRLVEPLVSAVYAADMERLSVLATLSQFREMEEQYGSLIRAMRQRMKRRPKGESGDSGARYSMFVTPRSGLSGMVQAVASRLPAGTVRLGTTVEGIARDETGRWRLSFRTDGQEACGTETFDGVILATPSHVVARLLAPLDAELGGWLSGIEHSGTAIVSVAYRRDQVRHPLDGMGAVVPAVENSPLLACSFSSQKYPHRAPPETVLLRLFAGGARHPELLELPDDALLPLVLGELDRLLGIRGEPIYRRLARWPQTMPQYHVGHRELVAKIRHRMASLPGLALAGNSFGGVGIPHCIHSGQEAAQGLLRSETV